MNTITKHYIDGAFVESHGTEVMDIIKPTSGRVIGCVTLADEEDTKHAIAAATAIPIGTVQWRVFNAQKKLAARLNGPGFPRRKAA